MKKLGYIITKSKISNLPHFIGVTQNIEDCEQDKPRLIVGLKNAKEYAPNFSIINNKLDDKTYWAFAKTEKRNMNERSLFQFYNDVLAQSIGNIKYYYVNLLCLGLDRAKKVLMLLNSDISKHIYICDDMIYVFNGEYILGISLKLAKYCKLSPIKLIERAKTSKNSIVRENSYNGGSVINKILSEKRYLTPFFMSLER